MKSTGSAAPVNHLIHQYPKQASDSSRERSCSLNLGENLTNWIKNILFGQKTISRTESLNNAEGFDTVCKESVRRMLKVFGEDKKLFEKETISEASTADSDCEGDKGFANTEGDFSIESFRRTNDEVRHRYIQKLIKMKIMKLEPVKKHQTIIIFDWDDTLLPTYFLSKHGYHKLSEDVLEDLTSLDRSARRLLLKALSLGQTFIISNASVEWVQSTAKRFLLRTHKLIIERGIKVISARENYEDKFPGDSRRWKVEAFLEIEQYFDKDIITNVICFGDSHVEMNAAHGLGKKFRHAIIKTIKFREDPMLDELIKQQETVKENLDQIYLGVKNIDIRLERRPTKEDESGEEEDERNF